MVNKLSFIIAAALVTVIIFCIYYKTLHYGFLQWDDVQFIVNNEHLRSLNLHNLIWAFTSFDLNCWIPLAWLSFALNYQFFGLDPYSYHLTNIILHCCNVIIVVLISRAILPLIRSKEELDAAPLFSLIFPIMAGLFWGIHPLRVESVAWVVERKDVLGGFFALLSMLFYLLQTSAEMNPSEKSRQKRRYFKILSIAMFTLSMLDKAMASTLPIIFVIYELSRAKNRITAAHVKTAVYNNLATIIISIVFSVITFIAQSPNIKTLHDFSPVSRFISTVIAVGGYFSKLFYPVNLSPKYHHVSDTLYLTDPRFYAASIIIIAILSVCIITRRKYPVLTLAVIGYLVMLLPSPSFVQVGSEYMADRYTYLPSIFIIMAIAGFVSEQFSILLRRPGFGKTAAILVGGGAVSVALALGVMSSRQIEVWKDDLSLLSRAIEINPNNVGSIYFNRAMLHMDLGNYDSALSDINKALDIAYAKKVSKIHYLHYLRGEIWFNLGRFDFALKDLDQAITLAPRQVEDYYSLRSETFAALGMTKEAESDRKMAAGLATLPHGGLMPQKTD